MLSTNQLLGIFIFAMTLLSATSNTVNTSKNTLNFTIINKDKTIGTLKATKVVNGSKTYYQSITAIKTRVIKEIEVDYKYDVVFEDNLLKKASVIIGVDDKPYADIITNRADQTYLITKNKKKESVIENAIHYATIVLYFKEPIGIDSCYSEQDGSFNTIVPLGNHVYKKVNAKKHENVYYYESGYLQKAEIDGGLIKFEIVAEN